MVRWEVVVGAGAAEDVFVGGAAGSPFASRMQVLNLEPAQTGRQ
jgi:hypothetical protein